MRHLLAAILALFFLSASHAALQREPASPEPIPDLKPPMVAVPILMEKRSWLWAWIAGGVLVASLITTFALAVPQKPVAAESPYRLVRKALEDVRGGTNPTLVWSIFRNYVHLRFGLKRGSTPDEIIVGLTAVTTIREKTRTEMSHLFEECDIARFASSGNTVPNLVERAMALVNALESQQSEVETHMLT